MPQVPTGYDWLDTRCATHLKSCTPPNLVAAKGHYSGVDHPLVGVDASTLTRISCGETSSAIQLQLGPLSTDTGLSTLVQSVQDSDEWEQTGLATSLTISRECARERNTSAEDIAHRNSDYIMEEGEEHKNAGTAIGVGSILDLETPRGEDRRCDANNDAAETEAEPSKIEEVDRRSENSSPQTGILKARTQETESSHYEIDSQNVAAEVYSCAHSNGSPICGFVKANLNSQIHKNAHSSGSPTCGHCSYTEPRSCTEPKLASISKNKSQEEDRKSSNGNE